MRRTARFHADKARWQQQEEGQDIAAAQRLGDNDVAACIGAMNLENMLGQIKAGARDNR